MDDIKQELNGFVRDQFKQNITDKNRDAIRGAWEQLCETGVFDACLNELDISPEAQAAFIHYLAEKYPAQFNEEPSFKKFIGTSFCHDKIYPAHAVRFAAETGLDALLRAKESLDKKPSPDELRVIRRNAKAFALFSNQSLEEKSQAKSGDKKEPGGHKGP